MKRLSLLVIVLQPFTSRVVSRRTIELDRSDGRDHEIGAAFRTTELVVPVDIELVNVNLRIACGAAGHERYCAGIITRRVERRNAALSTRGLSAGTQRPIEPPMAASATASKTVVVADETSDVRNRFAAALKDAGHTAIGVGTAPELLACLEARADAVDLVVLNLRLVPPPPIDLIRAIRECGACRLPILIFSGSITNAREIRQLASLGVAGYVNEHSGAGHIVPALAPHLFPDSFNRRLSPRVTLGIPVACRFEGTITAARTLDLGKGGLGVWTTNPLPPGTAVHVQFRLPATERAVEARSRVVWSDRRRGMGLRFEQVDSADQAAIDEFVDRPPAGSEQ